MVNDVTLIGHLGADPEMRYTQQNTPVATFNMAMTEVWKDRETGEKKENTEWVRIVAWNNLGEIAQKYLKRGSRVYVRGSIHTRQYEDKEGVKHWTTEVKARDLKLLDRREGNRPPAPEEEQGRPSPAGKFDDVDDDLPF